MALKSPRFSSNQRLQQASENNPPLKTGETGEAVRLIQQALIELGFALPQSTKQHGSPDGVYGEETFEAVKQFQAKHGLKAEGWVGRNTLAKLEELLPGAGPKLPPVRAKEG